MVHHPAQFVREDRQPLTRAVLRLQLGEALLHLVVLLGAEHRGLAERPLQPGVAALAVADAHDLAARFLLRRDESSVAAKQLTGLEAGDRIDLEHDGHGDDAADAGDGLQRGQFGGVVHLGGDLDVAFEVADLGVERTEQVESGLDAAATVDVGDVGGLLLLV